jgi:predicted deacylase
VHPEGFKLSQFPRGTKHSLTLDFKAGEQSLSIPVILFRGAREGKVLTVLAGIHGDEYEGVRAVIEVCSKLDPADMTGDFIAVPVANCTALWAGTRTSPLDNTDLARSFPGDLKSSPTRAIAYHLAHAVIAPADLLLDLHSGGVKYTMPTMIGYNATDDRGRAAARAFGAKVLWAHPVLHPGRTVSFAEERGIPWLYTEARGAGRIDPEDLRVFKQGITNLLQHLSILPGSPVAVTADWDLLGDGAFETSLRSTTKGFFISSVGLLEVVKAGQELGRVLDLHGNTIETFIAPAGGVVGMLREFPVVEPNTEMYLVTGLTAENKNAKTKI